MVQASLNEDRMMQKKEVSARVSLFFYVLGMTNGHCFTKIASHLFSAWKLST